MTLKHDLPCAIGRGELALWFQPRVALGAAHDAQLEAVLRWHHPTFGTVDATELAVLAEHSGFVPELTRFAILHALAQRRHWARDGLYVTVSIRLTAIDLCDRGLPEFIRARLAAVPPPGTKLLLHFPENALRIEHANERLVALRDSGAHLGVCEFGTGATSVPQLRKLPIEQLSIDRSFGVHLADDDDAVFVRTAIGLGHEMGLKMITTGVADESSCRMLERLKCDFARGPAISAPLPAKEVAEWLFAHRAARSPQTRLRLAG